jgi:hypothetical protein
MMQFYSDSPAIAGDYQAVLHESLSNVNLEDRAFFDHAQYIDKGSEKNPASKYFQKEALHISQMVFIVLI